MKVIKVISLLLLSLLSSIAYCQQGFPVNLDGESLKSNLRKLNDEIVAFDAVVVAVHKAYVDKPYYQVEFQNGQKIWIGSLVNSGFEIVGNKLRILGYLTKVKRNDDISRKYNLDVYHILAFGVLDHNTKQFSYLPGSETQAEEWMNGKIPVAD